MERFSYDFYKVLLARLLSTFGAYASMMSMNIFVYELTSSEFWVGTVMAIQVVAGIFFSPFLGHLADLVSQKNLMILAKVVLSLAMLVLLVVPSQYILWYILLWATLVGICSNLFDISLKSLIPTVVPTEKMLKANSLLMGGTNTIVAASGICMAFQKWLFKSYSYVFALTALTYILSALLLASLKTKTTSAPEEKKPEKKEDWKTFWGKIRGAYSEIFLLDQHKVVFFMLVILLFDAFGSASHNVGFPIFSKNLRPQEPMFYYGMIIAFWGMGNLMGIFFLNQWTFLQRIEKQNLYMFFTVVMSLGMVLIFQTSYSLLIFGFAWLAGVGDGTYQTYYTTYIQQIGGNIRGKLFALTSVVIRLGFSLGFVVVPLVLEFLSVEITVLLFHLPVIAITGYYLIGYFLKSEKKEMTHVGQ